MLKGWFRRHMYPKEISPLDLAHAAGSVAEYGRDTMDAYVWQLLVRLSRAKDDDERLILQGEASVVVNLIRGLETSIQLGGAASSKR